MGQGSNSGPGGAGRDRAARRGREIVFGSAPSRTRSSSFDDAARIGRDIVTGSAPSSDNSATLGSGGGTSDAGPTLRRKSPEAAGGSSVTPAATSPEPVADQTRSSTVLRQESGRRRQRSAVATVLGLASTTRKTLLGQ